MLLDYRRRSTYTDNIRLIVITDHVNYTLITRYRVDMSQCNVLRPQTSHYPRGIVYLVHFYPIFGVCLSCQVFTLQHVTCVMGGVSFRERERESHSKKTPYYYITNGGQINRVNVLLNPPFSLKSCTVSLLKSLRALPLIRHRQPHSILTCLLLMNWCSV